MPDIRLLVFPLDLDSSKGFISVANALGITVIGASSAMHTAGDHTLDEFIKLPYITDSTFETEFRTILKHHGISHIYAPHTGVWTLFQSLQKQEPDTFKYTLCEPSPYVADWLEFEASYRWSEAFLDSQFVEHLELGDAVAQPALSRGQYAGLHKQFIRIPGQCDPLKLSAFCHIARVIPQGDLIEIGSLWGRSAFAIAWLAKHYRIGNFFSVDPWENAKTEDQGEQAGILNSELEQATDIIDFGKVFLGYIANVALLDNVGYIRDISSKAINQYKNALKTKLIESPGLGKLPTSGAIALLHIDGNHRYDHVCSDIELWAPFVKPGGWILLDDYVWAFGDGPKRAGDEILKTNGFDIAFSMSDTLFLRKEL